MLNLVRQEEEDRRDAERRRVLLSGQLHTSTTALRVRIRDLSGGGARIEGEMIPRPGTVICLQRGSRAAYGAIAWADEGAAGVQFDDELDEDFFGADPGAEKAAAPTPEPYRRPGFGRRDDRPLLSTGDGWIQPSDLIGRS